MNDINDIERSPDYIIISGKKYKVRFTMASLKYLAQKHGSAIKALGKMDKVDMQGLDEKALELLGDLIYAGVISSGLTREDIDADMTFVEIQESMEPLMSAIMDDMPQKPQRSKKRGKR